MIRRVFVPLVLVTAGFVAGLVVTGRMPTTGDSRAETLSAARQLPGTPRAMPPASAGSVSNGGPDFTRVAAQAVKGVANISSVTVVRTRNTLPDDEFFRYFFGDSDVFGPRDRRSLSLGSGVIISSDGYVVTNNHVIGENVRAASAEITASLPDKREVRGRIVGVDPATDIALVKLNLRDLPALPWGDSSQLKVGEWVLAIGSPFQLSQTVTAGIVSATGRAQLGFADYEDFIQTDAAINPGNSGGALLNTRGELIGINTGIFSQSGGYQGIGFAVPSNLARKVMDDLIRYGEVKRGYLGYFETIALTPDLAVQIGVDRTRGIVVSRVERTSAAYQAGLRPGDVILAFNNVTLDDGGQLQRLISDARVGSIVTLHVQRGNRTVAIEVPVTQAVSRRVSTNY
jgi:serine protease Do